MPTADPTSISIVIPAYNEGRRLRRACTLVTEFLNAGGYDWELIVVDDGSKDRTREIAEAYMQQHPTRMTVIGRDENLGKGATVRQGVLAATKSIVVFTDADQATPIEELPKFIEQLEAGADVVMGSRYLGESNVMQKQSLLRRLLSRSGNLLIRVVLGLPYTDTQCGFKAMTKQAAQTIFERLTITRWGFDIEAIVIARTHRLKVVEIPVKWHDGGESKLRAGRVAIATLRELLVIRMNLMKGRYA